jgi:NADH:ubiquinone oxidoreductase subunit 5 (subunit L)/multisubunit Na+/H+ antiporter MnhA subunit
MTVKIRALGLMLGFALAAGFCQLAFGWNGRGHMSVAYIAYNYGRQSKRMLR